jgi:hypothetical protein
MVMLLAAAFFPVHVQPEGLRCYDFFGIYHLAKWSEITAVRPIWILGLRYLRVRSRDCPRVVWLPLFLAGKEEFTALVRERAGEEHMLTRFLTGQAA